MAPEDAVIDSSSLTKFRKLRLKDMNLLDMLIGKTVEICVTGTKQMRKRISFNEFFYTNECGNEGF
jgi:hypothetical protein